MKHGFKLFIAVLLTLSIRASAQLSFRGESNLQGFSQNNKDAFKNMGLLAEWQAGRGMLFSSTTNLQIWCDVSGNGYNLTDYPNTSSPIFSSSYGTNNFPVVYFNGPNKKLQGNKLASDMAGNGSGTGANGCFKSGGFTIIQLLNARTNQASSYSMAFGYSQAANVSFSRLTLQPSSTASTNIQYNGGIDNQNLFGTFFPTPGTSDTNMFRYIGMNYSNGIVRVFNNLEGISTNFGTTRTIDSFTVGALSGTNNTLSGFWAGGITTILVFTNYMSPANYTNVINMLNVNTRKVF